MEKHPNAGDLVSYARGDLPEHKTQGVFAHIIECPHCQKIAVPLQAYFAEQQRNKNVRRRFNLEE